MKEYALSFEFEGSTIETNEKGHLVNLSDWNEEIGKALAAAEDITLTDRHWDVLNYLREEYLDHQENQPNTRAIIKAMNAEWGEKLSQKDLYALFPGDPSKQGSKIAGLPESRRKGGY